MQSHPLRTLGTMVGLISLVLAVACGGSPHDRAEVLMDSAVERLTVQRARLDGIISSVEERARGGCEAVHPQTDITLTWGKPPDVQRAMSDRSGEYIRVRAECLSSVRVISGELADARQARDYLSPEALARRVTSLRARLATVSPDVLERVLDAARTGDEAWVALNQLNASGGRGERGADEWNSVISESEELLDRELADIARSIPLAQEQWNQYHELAGVPVPEP